MTSSGSTVRTSSDTNPRAPEPSPRLRPAWLITIDTEGDNLWAAPRTITTENSRYLPRFQTLCERYGLRPTYLTNWEMAQCPVFVEFARDVLARGTGEVGMHLHAWNNPPLVPLTDDDYRWRPYLIEYPAPVMREKIVRLTDALRNTFADPIVSHRAGRWALDATYARLLIEQGYQVDCSMTPHVTWRHDRGAPQGQGGCDYRRVPTGAFWIDPSDVQRPGRSSLLEIPMTIARGHAHIVSRGVHRLVTRSALGRRIAERVFPPVHWFRPNRRNGPRMHRILARAQTSRQAYVEMMLHSSELMPGGSPYFPDERSIERLYEDLESLFASGRDSFEGLTLRQYHDRFAQLGPAAGATNATLPAESGTRG